MGSPTYVTQACRNDTMLCEHAMGNYRVLCTMAGELLATAAQQNRTQMDEKLYFECFAPPAPKNNRKKS